MDAYTTDNAREGDRWLHAAQSRQPRGAIARAWITFADLSMATVRGAEQNDRWEEAQTFVEQALLEAQQRRIPLYMPILLLEHGCCLEHLERLQEAEDKYHEQWSAPAQQN